MSFSRITSNTHFFVIFKRLNDLAYYLRKMSFSFLTFNYPNRSPPLLQYWFDMLLTNFITGDPYWQLHWQALGYFSRMVVYQPSPLP